MMLFDTNRQFQLLYSGSDKRRFNYESNIFLPSESSWPVRRNPNSKDPLSFNENVFLNKRGSCLGVRHRI